MNADPWYHEEIHVADEQPYMRAPETPVLGRTHPADEALAASESR